jgi:germination protein M
MKSKSIIALLLAAVVMAGLAGCRKALAPEPSPSVSAEISQGVSSEMSPGVSPGQSPEVSQEPSWTSASEAPTEPSHTPGVSEAPAGATMDIVVYYLKSGESQLYLVREVHTLPKTVGVARAALNELISGTPLTEGAYRVLSPDTKILGITIEDGLATVDFSREVLYANVGSSGESLGIDSIVNTLTEFPTIDRVAFTVEGSAENGMDWWGHVGLYEQPFTRYLGMVLEPRIWVTAPAAEEKVASPIALRGSAAVFEGTVRYRLTDDDGNILADSFTTAIISEFYRGDFEASIPFEPTAAGKGQLEVFWENAENGSEADKVTVPVTW